MKFILLGAFCLVAGVPAVRAQEKATIPYAKVYDAFQRAAVVRTKEVRVAIAVASKNETVSPGAVTLTIQAKGGARKLHVDPDGEIQGFPLSNKLLKENPPIVSNQPKGTLRLGGGLFFNVQPATTYRYRKLDSLLDAGNAVSKKRAGFFSLVAPQAKSVLFVFFHHVGQTLTVHSKSAPQTLTANEKGEISLRLDKALLAENPRVTLSEKPSKVLPDL